MSTRFVVAAVVGVAVGYFTDNPQAGFAAFSLVYGVTGFLDPTKKNFGSRLDDLRAPQASYGSPIPYIEGTMRTGGLFIWSSPKRSIADTVSSDGKGGPSVENTTYTYEMDLLVKMSINKLQGLLRVFSNGKLVWSQAGSDGYDTLHAAALTDAWKEIRFYDGNPAQLPDPDYEAAVGIGNVPAYRGSSTIFIKGLNLGSSGQLPILTFVVFSAGSGSYVVGSPGATFSGYFKPAASSMSKAGFSVHQPQWDNSYSTDVVNIYSIDSTGGTATFSGQYRVGNPLGNILQGTTDLDCLVQADPDTMSDVVMYRGDGSSVVRYIFSPISGSSQRTVFAIRGSDAVFGADSGDPRLYAANVDGGFASAVSATMASGVQSIAISSDGFVYATLSSAPYSVIKFDFATLTVQATIALPAIPETTVFVCCDGTRLYLRAGDDVYLYNGTGWDVVFTGLPIELQLVTTDDESFSIQDGQLFSIYKDGTTETLWTALPSTTVSTVTLDGVVTRLCERTGLLTAGDIDVSDLASDTVDGFAVTQVAPTRTALETLMAWYLFEPTEDSKIKFVKRGGAPVVTIPFEDLGATESNSGEPLPITRLNDIEQPCRVIVKYANALNDFQDGAETSNRFNTQSTSTLVSEFTIAATPTAAKRVADVNIRDIEVGRIGIGPINLTRKYPQLQAADVILATAKDGSTYRARITKLTYSGPVTTLELVADDASSINSVASTDSDYASSTTIKLVGDTRTELLDVPLLRDADDAPGMYVAMEPISPTATFIGASLYKSGDDVTYSKVLDDPTAAIIGVTTTVLGPWDGKYQFDEVSNVTVDVGAGSTLSSSDRMTLLTSDANAILIGSEIVQYRDAATVSDGVFTLSGFLRARRGTEWATDTHAVNERVVLLTAGSIRRVVDQQSEIGISRHWKGVTAGKVVANARSFLFTDTGVSEKPFSPVDLRVATTSGQDLVIFWKRRSRLATRLVGTAGISAPLGEAIEAYSVDVFSGSTLLRTLSSPVQSVVYSRAMQLADGVTASSSLRFDVYQISATIGRGYSASVGGTGAVAPLPQISTVTIDGAFATGAPVFTVLGSTRFDHTSSGGDANDAGIATALAALIDADASYAATAAGGVVTITGPLSTPFAIISGIDAGDNSIALALAQRASPIVAGAREEFNFGYGSLGGPYNAPVGSGFYLVIRRISPSMQLSYSVFSDTANSSYIAGALHDLQNAFVASGDGPRYDLQYTYIPGEIEAVIHTPLVDPENWDVVAATSWTGNGLQGLVGRRGSGQTPVPAPLAQVITAHLIGTPVTGRIYRLTLAGADFDYAATGGDTTMSAVAAGLAPVIDADAAYVASAVGDVITVTGATTNSPFTYQAAVIVSTVTATAATTQEAA